MLTSLCSKVTSTTLRCTNALDHAQTLSAPAYAEMLPNLQQGQDTKLTLKRIHAGYPALSLDDADVVYICTDLIPVRTRRR